MSSNDVQNASQTETVTVTAENQTQHENGEQSLQGRRSPKLRLQLQPPQNDHRVTWTADVVDNEHMNKKKSKCCCQYKKPREWNESSSSSEDEMECDHCSGHVEKKKRPQEEKHKS